MKACSLIVLSSLACLKPSSHDFEKHGYSIQNTHHMNFERSRCYLLNDANIFI